MTSAELPEDGPVRLGPVMLPAGRRVNAMEGNGQPVAWVTSADVPGSGRVWSTLSDLRGQTGLVPVLLDGADDESGYFFYRPADVAEIDRMDGAAVLTEMWDAKHEDTSGPAPRWDTPLSNQFLGLDQPLIGGQGVGDLAAAIIKVMMDPAANAELERLNQIDRRNAMQAQPTPAEPEHRDEPEPFPGLAPRTEGRLTQAERDSALASLRPARIGLIPAGRPADAPAVIGWSVFGVDPYPIGPVPVSTNAVWVGAVLRSFEDRFGATLLKLGPGAELQLFVERPPRTLEDATRIAAEHSVFCDECGGQGLPDIPGIAAALVNAPIWTFWWD